MNVQEILKKYLSEHRLNRDIRIMEVCGTHTVQLAKTGIKGLMPENVTLLSGPGCPVCVTDSRDIDAVLELSMEKSSVICTYGDMLRVPGSRPGDSLARRRALGADVRIVYSSMDAVETAEKEPDKTVYFIGIGFETTAPGTAFAVLSAEDRNLKNFRLINLLKSVRPGLESLLSEDIHIDGLLCPGHVAVITGEEPFREIAEKFSIPCVIGGFESDELALAVLALLRKIEKNDCTLTNAYDRVVRKDGNPAAQEVMKQIFEPCTSIWRGLGEVPGGGFKLIPQYMKYNADISRIYPDTLTAVTGCRCGDVITGRISPCDCPLFGNVCSPDNPVGPCMVSSEGSCGAAWNYM